MSTGSAVPRARTGRPAARARVSRADDRVPPGGRQRRDRLRRAVAVTTRIRGLTRLTLQETPGVCHECVWWQSKTGRRANKRPLDRSCRGRFRALGRALLRRRRPSDRLDAVRPRAVLPAGLELPAGPPSEDAVLVTCTYLLDRTSPWVLQSLFLAAIGEARDKGGEGARDVRLSLPGGRIRSTNGSRYTDDLPARLPFGLRLSNRAHGGSRRAGATRVRWPDPGRRGAAREGAPRSSARPSRRRRCLSGPELRRRREAAPGVSDARGCRDHEHDRGH